MASNVSKDWDMLWHCTWELPFISEGLMSLVLWLIQNLGALMWLICVLIDRKPEIISLYMIQMPESHTKWEFTEVWLSYHLGSVVVLNVS